MVRMGGRIGRAGREAVRLGLGLLLSGLGLVCAAEAGGPDSGEVRAVWASRFQWASATTSTARASITALMDGMTSGNFNCVFFQVRGQCDVFYPSPHEPWSPLISPGGTDPGWDPLDFALAEAHSRGHQLHAYFNTHTVWMGNSAPASPHHVFNTHPDWVLHDSNGNPAAPDSYHWLNPGLPEADAHVRREAHFLAARYPLDGLHLDRVRMPQAGSGHHPRVVARWDDPATPQPRDGPGNPDQLDWDAFMRECVTRQVINIAGQVRAASPALVLSSAPLGDRDQGLQLGQDAGAWMEAGAQDFIVPQLYFANTPARPRFNEEFDVWRTVADQAGRFLVPGSEMNSGLEEAESHVVYAREQGARGHAIWHSQIAEFPRWAEPGRVYETPPPPLPRFPWREAEGIINGYVWLDGEAPEGERVPAVDAWVSRSGSDWTALSSGDGFFSFLRVPPGTYTVVANHPVAGLLKAENVAVQGGQVTTVTLTRVTETPAAPSDLAAETSEAGVLLSWKDNSLGETGFRIYRSTVSGGPYEPVATTPPNRRQWRDLPPSGRSFYVVRAVNVLGESAPSAEASVLFESAAPEDLEAVTTAGQPRVALTWTGRTRTETGWAVLRATDPSGPWLRLASLPSGSTSYVDDAVLYGMDRSWNGSFHYLVRPVFAQGDGPDSNRVEVAREGVPDLVLESRDWSGGVAAGYFEWAPPAASWQSTTAKSRVTDPAVRAPGGRWTGTGSLGARAWFEPRIFVPGRYEVLVTGPGPSSGANVNSPGTLVEVVDLPDGTEAVESRTYNNSRLESALADRWMPFSPPLIAEFPVNTGTLPAGPARVIRFTNRHSGSHTTSHRFNIDAIRLRYAGPLFTRAAGSGLYAE